jgi:multidrug transporter EmrE-like cation transporter
MENNIINNDSDNNNKNSLNLDIIKLIFFVVLSESIAQYNIKESLEKQSNIRFIFAIFAYVFVCLFLRQIYNNKGSIGITNVIWSILSIVSILIVGIVFFHEKVNNWDLLGIFFAIMGLYFIYVKGHPSK